MIVGVDQVDLTTAQFSYELSLGGLAEVALKTIESMDPMPPSWWLHPIRRLRWDAQVDLMMAFFTAAEQTKREQESAR